MDALVVRDALEQKLKDDVKARLRRGEEVYIGVLAAGGYEFAVAMAAVLAIGAAVVPMSKLQRFMLSSAEHAFVDPSQPSRTQQKK